MKSDKRSKVLRNSRDNEPAEIMKRAARVAKLLGGESERERDRLTLAYMAGFAEHLPKRIKGGDV